jgi:hypothetical protein
MEKLARATGGKILSSIKDLHADALGKAKKVEEVKIGDDKLIYVRECKNPKAVTVVIRGGSSHIIDEAERSLHDGLCVVRNVIEDGKIVLAAERRSGQGFVTQSRLGTNNQQLKRRSHRSIPDIGGKRRVRPNRCHGGAQAKHDEPEGKYLDRSHHRQD